MLFLIAVVLSVCIVLLTVSQSRRLFGYLKGSLEQMTRLARGLNSVDNPSAFQAWLKEWPQEKGGLATRLVKRFQRICGRRGLDGWIIDIDSLCDGKSWLRNERGYERIQAMPGILTGIGILFTFMGLTLGIFGLDPTDAERLTQGVRGLLGGMSLAFLTSIAGIGSALWWTWKAKGMAESYDALADQIAQSIRDKLFFTTPEEIPNRMLEKMSLQNQYLGDMENTMMVAFRRALEDQGWVHIQESIARLLSKQQNQEPLIDRLDAVVDNTVGLASGMQQSLKFQEEVLKALEGGIGGGSGAGGSVNWENPQDRAAFLRDTQALAGNVARIHGAQQHMNQHLTETAKTLKEMMETARLANADIIHTHRELTTQLERLEKHWDGYREQILEMHKSLRMAIETFQKRLQATLQSAHGEIDGLLGESIRHFTGALDNFEATIESFAILLKTGQAGGKKGKWLNKVKT